MTEGRHRPSGREERPRVLVVAQEDDTREVMIEILRLDSLAIDSAPSGAVAVMRASVAPPDVVVLDVPGLRSIDEDRRCVAELRRRLDPPPALVISTATPAAASWYLPGVSVLLVKPFELDALRGAVKLAARTIEPSAPASSGMRARVRASEIVVLASALRSPELEVVVSERIPGARFVVVSSWADAEHAMRAHEPDLVLATEADVPHVRGSAFRVLSTTPRAGRSRA